MKKGLKKSLSWILVMIMVMELFPSLNSKIQDVQAADELTNDINNASYYTIEASVPEIDFGMKNAGYTSVPDKQEITITNTGDHNVKISKNTLKDYIVSDFSKSELAPNEMATFTVQPKTSLSNGTHNETITVRTENNTDAKILLKFKVNRTFIALMNLDSKTIVYGDSQTLAVTSSGGSEEYTYRWYEGNSDTVFATTKSVVVSPKKSTVYRAIISDGIEEKELFSNITVTPSVFYDANGGSGSMSYTTLNEGESLELTLPECKFKAPSGMFFKTWAIGSPDSKITRNPGEKYTFTKATTVYAVWYDGLIWSDEFNGTALDENVWSYDTGNGSWGWGNGEVEYYTDRTDNVKVSDGSLQITAKKENYRGYKYTSGRIKSIGKKAFKYGLIEARIKVENGNQDGVWPAFWMMGNNMNEGIGWPNCGEIDIMEHANSEAFVSNCLHWNYNGINGSSDAHGAYGSGMAGQNYYFEDNVNKGINGWHIYGLLWDESHMEFQVDGKTYFSQSITTSNAYCFRKDQFFLFNLAIGGTGTGFTSNKTANASTFKTTTMYVDYLRVYQNGSKGSYGAALIPPDNARKAPAYVPETTSKSEQETVTYITVEEVDAILKNNQLFKTYAGMGWAGSAISSSNSSATGVEVQVQDAGESIAGLQAYSQDIAVISGNTYRLNTTLESDIDKTVVVEVNGYEYSEQPISALRNSKLYKSINVFALNSNAEESATNEEEVTNTFYRKVVSLKAGVPYVIDEDVVIPQRFSGIVDIDYSFGKDTNEELSKNSFTFKISNTSFKTMENIVHSEIVTTTTPEITTTPQITTTPSDLTKPEDTTSSAITTKHEETVTQQTTTKQEVTKDQTTLAKSIAKVTVKKAVKKKSAKKVKVTLAKKANGIKGYQLCFYKTKKNAKANKKAIVKIIYNKNKKTLTVGHKKLKGKVTLYIRTRAYVIVNKKKVYGQWSAVKKVKVTK